MTLAPPISYCMTCDAEPGQCQHPGLRYIDPVTYTNVASAGWTLPTNETWEARHEHQNTLRGPSGNAPVDNTKTINQLIAELEQWVDLNNGLERTLREAHDHNPIRTTRIADGVITDTRNKKLTSPGGILNKRLRELLAA